MAFFIPFLSAKKLNIKNNYKRKKRGRQKEKRKVLNYSYSHINSTGFYIR
jgi:hypothetical protein